jgi:hypothetical protein
VQITADAPVRTLVSGDVRYLTVVTEKDVVTQPVARSVILGAEHVVMQQAVLAATRGTSDCSTMPGCVR